jgi:hypothetical protein
MGLCLSVCIGVEEGADEACFLDRQSCEIDMTVF